MRRQRFVTRAHAKLNLDLRVLGRRADGLHELRTIYQSIELADCLTVTVRPGPFELRCNDPSVPIGRDNLVWEAAVRAFRIVGRGTPRDLSVVIDKRIPLEAG
ncbi:MAG: 4-(cytidine 5'-diphospho)-2-C-methyl-D-erythritol kinase, partial [Acidobacteriota bacterium]|nr:4-(cytidine 5'-diphospho)-2-C-methyl-D-erythritol kinase [Acidobacteriota bacterium]